MTATLQTSPPIQSEAFHNSAEIKTNVTSSEWAPQEPLVVYLAKEYFFWNHGQTRLCRMLQDVTLSPIKQELPDYFRDPIAERPIPKIITELDCENIRNWKGFGEGNWVSAIYSQRMAAAKAKVDHEFRCLEGTDKPLTLILPWLQGEHKAPTMEDPWPYIGPNPTVETVCKQSYTHARLDTYADQIQDDMRKMAVSLVGSQKDGIRQHPDVPIDQPPMVPNVALDDVVIHFRCGDLMGGGSRHRRKDYGIIQFTEYLKHIDKNATKRIGILTQSFNRSQLRTQDASGAERCKVATHSLVNYLQQFLPDATITIHNGPNETIPLVYARLVMAKQAFMSLSSLTLFPVIGTFGKGYFQKGNKGVNPFAHYLPEKMSYLTMMEAPWLSQKEISAKGFENTLKWFVGVVAKGN